MTAMAISALGFDWLSVPTRHNQARCSIGALRLRPVAAFFALASVNRAIIALLSGLHSRDSFESRESRLRSESKSRHAGCSREITEPCLSFDYTESDFQVTDTPKTQPNIQKQFP